MCREAFTLTFSVSFAFGLCAAEPVRQDRFKDLLPEGAVFRLGTTRFRPSSAYYNLAASPDLKTFATGEHADPWTIRLWDSTTGKELWMCRLPNKVYCVRLIFSPDSKALMAIGLGTHDRRHRLFLMDAKSGNVLNETTLSGGHGQPQQWGFLLDGKRFLTQMEIEMPKGAPAAGLEHATRYETVPIVWDLTAGKEVHRFPPSTDIAVSPDGKTVALAFQDCLRVWDAASKRTVTDLRSDQAQFTSLTFSADGKTLAALRSTVLRGSAVNNDLETCTDFVCWNAYER
jgi:WD40 repeat protein